MSNYILLSYGEAENISHNCLIKNKVLKKKNAKSLSVSVVKKSELADKEHLSLIKSCARKTAGLLSLKGELSIAVVDDEEMRELNRRYRNISRTTDVLAFELDKPLMGEIVISFETARRRAGLYGITLEEEIKRLVVHGMAHIAGHTHKKKKDGEKMRAEELRILSAVSGL